MKYIVLGAVSSEAEFLDVFKRVEGPRMIAASELLDTLNDIETNGFVNARRRWKDATNEAAVKVYWDRPEPGFDETAIWAAIEVGADDRSITLIKITDQYTGGDAEWHDLLADALDRRIRGTIK